jgi:hypothetical protein
MSDKIYVTADEIGNISRFREEQETAINWFRDDDTITICTSDPTMVTKLKNVMKRDPDNYKCYYLKTNIVDGALGNYFFEMPKNLLTFRVATSGSEDRQPMSEEQRAAVGRRLHGKI